MIQLLYLDREELKAKTLLQLQIALKREKENLTYQQEKLFLRT